MFIHSNPEVLEPSLLQIQPLQVELKFAAEHTDSEGVLLEEGLVLMGNKDRVWALQQEITQNLCILSLVLY